MKLSNKSAPAGEQSRGKALDHIPLKNKDIHEFREESGTVTIHYPITMRPFFASLAKRLGGAHEQTRIRKLQLDILGTSVWEMMDGRQSVRQIITAFGKIHQLERREAEVAVTQFVRELGKRGLIGL